MKQNVKSSPEAQLRSFLARFDLDQRKFVRSVRAAVRKRLPTANELTYDYGRFFVIAYAPSLDGIDGIVSLAARADRVDLYFNHGPKLPDPKKLLRGSGKMVRFVQLATAREVSHPDIEAFIAESIQRSKIPLPSAGKGSLVIKTNKTGNDEKPARASTRSRRRAKQSKSGRKP